MSINNNLENLNKIIIQLDKEKNLKKKTELFNNSKKIISDCKNEISKIDECLKSEINSEKEEEINDEQYLIYIQELENIKNKMENSNLEECVNHYFNYNKLIKKCKSYLEKQKMEIINLA